MGALVRYDNESERFALKIAQLILPAPDHALAPLRELRQWYDTTYPYVSERPALGLIGALGFLGLLGYILVRLGTTGPLRAPAGDGTAGGPAAPAPRRPSATWRC